MADDNTKVSAKNAKALAKLYKTGIIGDVSTGWHSQSFEEKYPVDPVVVANGIGEGVTCQIKNVSKTGFDYRCLLNGSDSDGLSMTWIAYVLETSGNVVLDTVNGLIGTEYESIASLVANAADFDKVCSSKECMDVLFVYTPAVDEIAKSAGAIDVIIKNNTSWSALSGYTKLNSAIDGTEYGHAKKLYRTWSGNSDASSINSMGDFFSSSSFSSLAENESFLTSMFANDRDLGFIADSPAALNVLCRNHVARKKFNDSQSRLAGFYSRFLTSLSNTTYFTQTVSNRAYASNNGASSFFVNANYTTMTYYENDGEPYASASQGACFVMFDEIGNKYGSQLLTSYYWTIPDRSVFPAIERVKLGEGKKLVNKGPVAGGMSASVEQYHTNVRVFVAV